MMEEDSGSVNEIIPENFMDNTDISEEKPTHSESEENTNVVDNIPIVFKVQVTASSNPIPLDSDVFKDFNDIEEIKENGYFKYAVGSRKNYQEIECFYIFSVNKLYI